MRADGKCELCSDYLEDNWHAHHIKEFSNGGVTEIYNAMALCPSCHIEMHKHGVDDGRKD